MMTFEQVYQAVTNSEKIEYHKNESFWIAVFICQASSMTEERAWHKCSPCVVVTYVQLRLAAEEDGSEYTIESEDGKFLSLRRIETIQHFRW